MDFFGSKVWMCVRVVCGCVCVRVREAWVGERQRKGFQNRDGGGRPANEKITGQPERKSLSRGPQQLRALTFPVPQMVSSKKGPGRGWGRRKEQNWFQ